MTTDTRTWEERMADAYIKSGLPIIECPTCGGLSDQDGECLACERKQPKGIVKALSLIALASLVATN